jgi:hypothetical protein
MTRRITPMQEPANMPLEVMRQEDEMKPRFVRTLENAYEDMVWSSDSNRMIKAF